MATVLRVFAAAGLLTPFLHAQALPAIATASLPQAIVGQPYSQTLLANGRLPRYVWTRKGPLPPGVAFSADGVLSGSPAVADARSGAVTTPPAALTITLTGSLPATVVGSTYRQRLPLSVSGGQAPYVWSVASGLPPGLTFTPSDQMIAGTPERAGSFTFPVQITDANGVSGSRQLTIVVNAAALSITTSRQLPAGTLNQPYSAQLEAAGGQPPYRWSASGLPSGITINAATGQITGTALAAGEFPIGITVLDSALVNVVDRFTLIVTLPPPPFVTLSGVPRTASAGEQFSIGISLDSPYAAPIQGEAILIFAPDSGPTDRTVQFASGGTTAKFTIPAGSKSPVLSSPLAIQTGTVAGTISISLRLQAGGIDFPPASAVTTRIDRSAPVIRDVEMSRSGSTLTLVVSGYSTAREVSQATFTFKAAPGQSLQPASSSITISADGLFGPWFQDPATSQYGSQFMYTQPFTIQGDASAVLPETVTLTNRLGSTTFTVR